MISIGECYFDPIKSLHRDRREFEGERCLMNSETLSKLSLEPRREHFEPDIQSLSPKLSVKWTGYTFGHRVSRQHCDQVLMEQRLLRNLCHLGKDMANYSVL